MQNKLKNYLSEVGLQFANLDIEENFTDDLKAILEIQSDAKKDDEMNEIPYKLKEILFYNKFNDEDIFKLVSKLNQVVKFLYNEIGADWTGIYKKLDTKTGPALVKLVHRGFASRIEFPLTKKFAERSNNSAVGLSGKAVLINNVKKHLEEGKPYYKSDSKVQSELCVPIFSEEKKIIGIIDLESFGENFFDNKKIKKVAVTCLLLSDKL